MSQDLLGQTYALLSAVTWAFALILFKRSTECATPLALNLFKNAVGLVLLVVTLIVQPAWDPGGAGWLPDVSRGEIGILVLSGVIGIAIADTLFFKALHLIGVGLASIADCCYTPAVFLFSWLLLGAPLGAFQCIGGALVIASVLVASRHDPPQGRTRAQLAGGMVLAGAAVSLMGLGMVLVTPMLKHLSVVWVATVRLAAGSAVLALFAALGSDRRRSWAVFRPSALWKSALPGSVLGMYLCLLPWFAGFKYTHPAVAAALNQTSVVFAIILASIFLKEVFTRRKLAAAVLALAGVVVVTCAGWIDARWQALFQASPGG